MSARDLAFCAAVIVAMAVCGAAMRFLFTLF